MNADFRNAPDPGTIGSVATPFDGNIVTIQILRAVAAWLVVFSHFMQVFYNFEMTNPLGNFFSVYGFLGVDIFFVISGLVMYRTISSGRYTAIHFLANRAIRIVPAYWIATVVLVVLTLIGIVDRTYELALWTPRTLALSLGFIPHEHPSGIGFYPTLTVGWTLFFEMFFYLSLTVCMALFGRAALIVAGAVMIALPLISEPSWPAAPIVTSPLLLEFVAGLATGHALRRFPRPFLHRLAPLIGLALIALAMVYVAMIGVYFRYIVACLVVLAILMFESPVRRYPTVPVIRLLRALGDRSYSAYLYHPLVLFVLVTSFGLPTSHLEAITLLIMTIAGTSALSALSYARIEVDLSRRLKRT